MGKLKLLKSQKQELGRALAQGNFIPTDFELIESPYGKSRDDALRIRHKDTSEVFDVILIRPEDDSVDEEPYFNVERELVSSQVTATRDYADGWNQVVGYLESWARLLNEEVDAEDPWSEAEESAYEDMQNEDEGFSVDELPHVDRAIDAALKQLTDEAARKEGNDIADIKESVAQIEMVLKNTARNSSKREWLTVFKSVIATEIVKWGLEHNLLGSITHTLISAAQDIAQLADHASKLQL